MVGRLYHLSSIFGSRERIYLDQIILRTEDEELGGRFPGRVRHLMRTSSSYGGPPALACNLVWSVLSFVLGILYCRTTDKTPCVQPSSPTYREGSPLQQLLHHPSNKVPINHPDESGVASEVLKQVVIKPGGLVPHMVHLSVVDFGETGSFPEHKHNTGFNEVFLVTSGCGEMELDGRSTGPLTRGDAIHMPPGVKHKGRALRCRDSPGEHFEMAYFAILE